MTDDVIEPEPTKELSKLDQTLEWFKSHKLPARAGQVSMEMGLNSNKTASQRCLDLVRRGDLTRLEDGLFAIPGTFEQAPPTPAKTRSRAQTKEPNQLEKLEKAIAQKQKARDDLDREIAALLLAQTVLNNMKDD